MENEFDEDTPLDHALKMVAEMKGDEFTAVPSEPTPYMIKAGAAVGKISLETARQIYKAMLWAL